MEKIIVLNLKTYSSDLNAVEDAKEFDSVYIAPPLPLLSEAIKIHKNILSQHIDPVGYGACTGHIPPVLVKDLGAKGTLLNHSERRITFDVLEKAISICKENKLLTIVCARTPKEVEKVSILKPDYVAIEPPELIGSGVAVSKAQPKVITKSIEKSVVPVLCGAGISTAEDVKIAVELGADGVLVASAYTKNKKRKQWLKEIIKML